MSDADVTGLTARAAAPPHEGLSSADQHKDAKDNHQPGALLEDGRGGMGWSSTAMAARYHHVTGGILADVAQRVGGLIWEVANDSGAEGSEESR
jgi:hypothetical protein